MKNHNAKYQLMTIAALVVIVAVTGANLISAGAARTDFHTTGMFGIARGQTARLSVVGVEDPNLVPPGPCRVELSFVGSEGELLLPAVQRVLEPGRAIFLDLNRDSLDTAGPRIEVRAIVRAECPSDPSRQALMPTLEVFDNSSGRTSFVLPLVRHNHSVSSGDGVVRSGQ
ncbi:MAG TPA: hypothetical protein VFD58_11485 [Blastocatellia bacterium]|nr:hypothetical protein [Blastocatellia bacterium]